MKKTGLKSSRSFAKRRSTRASQDMGVLIDDRMLPVKQAYAAVIKSTNRRSFNTSKARRAFCEWGFAVYELKRESNKASVKLMDQNTFDQMPQAVNP